MVTMEQFHKELREKLGEDVSPNENCCPHYRYYLPSDAECPYETHPQRLFWMCERDFHRIYGCHDGCRSYLDLWAEWEANRDWVGPEQYVDVPVVDRLLAFWFMDDYNRYCPDGEFDLKAYFALDNRGGRPCQERRSCCR